MQVYTQELLSTKSKQELESLKEFVQSSDYTVEMKDLNIDEINIALNDGVKFTKENALELIEMVKPDTSDMEGLH